MSQNLINEIIEGHMSKSLVVQQLVEQGKISVNPSYTNLTEKERNELIRNTVKPIF